MAKIRFLSVLSLVFLASPAIRAQSPLGAVVASFPCTPTKVLSDPARPRVYIADARTNSILVIDTHTLARVASVQIGSNPTDLALSRDGKLLYAANRDMTSRAIGVLDLDTLTVRARYDVPANPVSVVAGLDGRLYVGTRADDNGVGYQLDLNKGGQATMFNAGGSCEIPNSLQISPDGKTLYLATFAAVYRSDVSTSVCSVLQGNRGTIGIYATLSHNGKYLYFPHPTNTSEITYLKSPLFAAADLTRSLGNFDNQGYSGPLAFSPDDTRFYQARFSEDPTHAYLPLDVFETSTLTKLSSTQIPSLGVNKPFSEVKSISVDNTGSYLFAGIDAQVNPGPDTEGRVDVVGTGTGTLEPPEPTISVEATVPRVVAGSGDRGIVTVTRSGNLAKKLSVLYAVKGSGKNGVDFAMLSGKVTFKRNRDSATIQITPALNEVEAGTKKVKLSLLPAASYQIGQNSKARIKIVFPGQ